MNDEVKEGFDTSATATQALAIIRFLDEGMISLSKSALDPLGSRCQEDNTRLGPVASPHGFGIAIVSRQHNGLQLMQNSVRFSLNDLALFDSRSFDLSQLGKCSLGGRSGAGRSDRHSLDKRSYPGWHPYLGAAVCREFDLPCGHSGVKQDLWL